MTRSAPPRPPSPARTARDNEPLEREEIEALVRALIEEARRETRRRRRRYWAVAALLASAGLALLVLLQSGGASQPGSSAASARSGLPAGAMTSKIAFISEPPVGGYCGTVYVMNPDGSGQRRLTNGGVPGCEQEGGPAWSPDGRRIALVAAFPPNAIGASTSKIVVVKRDGSGQRRLTRSAGEEHSPAWSPDGRQITFIRSDQRSRALYVVNADGTGRRRLTGNVVGGVFAPVWSPDGQRIAFVANTEIYVVNADGSGQRQLTRNGAQGFNPAWSPDGTRIAFESDWQVWAVNADGSGQRQLTRKGAHNFNPAWSPDGTRIAFERGRRRSPCSWCPGLWGYDVYVMNADGSGQQRLTRGASQPQWSPDGRKIAFVSQRDGNADIYVMNPNGSGQRNLTRTAGNKESQPVWSPAVQTSAR